MIPSHLYSDDLTASDFMVALPFYAPEETSVANVLDKINKHNLYDLIITDSNFIIIATIPKKMIIKFLLQNGIAKNDPRAEEIQIKELLDKCQEPVVAYQTSKISDIYSAMEILKLEHIPIVKSSWNKVLMGFVSFDKIKDYNRKEKHLQL